MNTKTKGDISVLKVATRLTEKGYTVSFPFGDRSKYDLILDNELTLQRIQVKTGRIRNGALRFDICSIVSKAKGKTIRKGYRGQIECFCVYSPELNKLYMFPAKMFDKIKTDAILRIDNPKNNQKSKIVWAKDFEI